MKSIQTTIDIDATPEQVFDVLVDFRGWTAWNPTLPWVRAEPRVGGRVALAVSVPGLPPMLFPAKMTRFERDREIAWAGGVAGVARGEHYFRLETLLDGSTRFVHGEDFTGLVPDLAMGPSTQRKLTAGYEAMNRALAERVSRGRR